MAELDHPGIMRLLGHWEPPEESHTCVSVMALSYARGPTLEKLLCYGRLSVTFSRVVMAQLVDALTYLHSRAVVHRDCKPDNLIVTGASDEQDEIWNDDENLDDNSKDWKALRKRWHVTLVDFGFARALTPQDLNKAPPKTTAQTSTATSAASSLDSSTRSNKSLNRSLSRHFGRRMSALGTRTYTAPEVIRGIQDRPLSNSSRHPMDITETLSAHVSYYGLMADAFSVGNTLKYMLTGVVPTEDVNQVIALQNSPISILCRFLCGGGAASSASKNERPVQYRKVSAIPKEALRLVKGLTQPDPQHRTSVRQARAYPWIDQVLQYNDSKPDAGFENKQEIDYLSFARGHPPKDEAMRTTA